MEVADRIVIKMKEHDLSQADLIRGTGAGRATVSGWVNGTNKPSAKHLEALVNTLHTTTGWLLTGDKDAGQSIQAVKAWEANTPLDDDEVDIPFFEDFSFACGGGALNEQMVNAKRKLKVPRATLRNLSIDKKNAVAAKASGDSMSPKIEDGDIIHIDIGRKTIKDGKTFVICLGGLNYAKKLYNMPFGGVRIVSNNAEEFPEIVLTKEEAEINQFEIIGWVWQVSKVDKW